MCECTLKGVWHLGFVTIPVNRRELCTVLHMTVQSNPRTKMLGNCTVTTSVSKHTHIAKCLTGGLTHEIFILKN